MTGRLTQAESLLQDLGVERAEDIDLEAIAWDCGARIKSRKLFSCEARIVGRGDRAIITVDEAVQPRRRRFSIAHELGHWRYHRHRCTICRSDQIGNARSAVTDPERVADDYASDLLLPAYILYPMLRAVPKPTLKAMRGVADAFDTSLTATLLKVVALDRFAIMIVCHGKAGRRWFRSAPSVPRRWFPQECLDRESCAFTLLNGSEEEQQFPRRIGADAWFDREGAGRFEVLEQSFSLPNEEVVTILQFDDEEMMDG